MNLCLRSAYETVPDLYTASRASRSDLKSHAKNPIGKTTIKKPFLAVTKVGLKYSQCETLIE